jgi:hypothetical protein
MRYILVMAILFGLSIGANAQEPETATIILTWTHPTTYDDASLLPIENIRETRVWCNRTGGWPPDYVVPAPITEVEVTLPYGKDHYCAAKTVVTGPEPNVSALSERVTFDIVKPAVIIHPNPPTNVTVILTPSD